MNNNSNPALHYKDVCLVPKFFPGASRDDLSVATDFLEWEFTNPVVPANMTCVINQEIALKLAKAGYFYIYHRFGDTLGFLRALHDASCALSSVSVGVGESGARQVLIMAQEGLKPAFLTIDVAHGHSSQAQKMVAFCRQKLPNTNIIAGNVATSDGISALVEAGADAVKVGIAQGAACSTYSATGHGLPMFSCALECQPKIINRFTRPVPVIIDGGVRCPGDVVRALVASYQSVPGTQRPETMVMVGGLFAACKDSPPETEITAGGAKKRYFGSASFEQKGDRKYVEGHVSLLQQDGKTILQKMEEFSDGLRSAISYSGGQELADLKHSEWRTIWASSV